MPNLNTFSLLFFFTYHVTLYCYAVDDFIKIECQATPYPPLCIRSLSACSAAIHRSPDRLVATALSISLSQAQSVARFVSTKSTLRGLKLTERRVLYDCTGNMVNTVDQLGRAIKELAGLPMDFGRRVKNIESWVAAAVTFHYTCLDGFSSLSVGGNVAVVVRERVLDCAHVASNSLALVRRFAARRGVGSSVGRENVP
ncbi:21 kDa protein-like [Andrographis paniculata]|uniref:21 kDa protein-like n=1 Tax=Andrographis paniculata TaxID=175694 RepID=UPI0021E8C61E|nr:21 kDa protein-like [Andrographis paniculata]